MDRLLPVADGEVAVRLSAGGQTPFYAGFAMTGVALTLPGALLPVLLRRWGLSDARGGVLLFCFFVASSAGALLARGRMDRRVAEGSALTAAGALGMAWAGRLTGFAAVSVFGLGLGLSMTAISLLQSRRFPAERRVVMTRLNLVWAIGAVAGPWLALHDWRGAGAGRGIGRGIGHGAGAAAGHQALWAVAAFFVVFALWVGCCEREPGANAPVVAARNRPWALLQVPWPLWVLVFCATGVEAAAGGWLTTFAQRSSHTLGVTIGAATLLWAGLLAGRAAHSLRAAARLAERTVLAASTAAMAGALTLLIAWPAPAVTLAAAAVLGFAAAPVYPLLLAMVLRQRETAAIFVVAGVGSSLLPLATGALSGAAHSLRVGLGVPLVAAVVMMALVAMGAGIGRTETA